MVEQPPAVNARMDLIPWSVWRQKAESPEMATHLQDPGCILVPWLQPALKPRDISFGSLCEMITGL